jgi:hypothetical protein
VVLKNAEASFSGVPSIPVSFRDDDAAVVAAIFLLKEKILVRVKPNRRRNNNAYRESHRWAFHDDGTVVV